MSDFDLLISDLEKFRDARDWQQFHNSKDLAVAKAIEAAELNELFLWNLSAGISFSQQPQNGYELIEQMYNANRSTW